MSSNNSPNLNDSSTLRNLPQSLHFNPRMGSPGKNLSPYSPHRVNSDNPNFISFNNSTPAENRQQSFRHFNKSPYNSRPKFRSNRNFSSPNTSINSSRNSSFSSTNNSFNCSQSYSPFSQKGSYDAHEEWENSESYRSMFGNPWAQLENELQQQYGDKLEPFSNIAVLRKTDK